MLLLFGASAKYVKKTNKTKLILCKPLFIVHGRVKGFFKVILQYNNEAPQLQKWHGTCTFYYLASPQSMLRKQIRLNQCSVSLHLLFMEELMVL